MVVATETGLTSLVRHTTFASAFTPSKMPFWRQRALELQYREVRSTQRCAHALVVPIGCAKEMLQAQVHAVYYLHEWTPHVKGEDLKTTQQRAEYDKLLMRFPGGVHALRMPDSQQKWAVLSSKRSVPVSTDEHGTLDIQ